MVASLHLLRMGAAAANLEVTRLAHHLGTIARPGRAEFARPLVFASLAAVPAPSLSTFGLFAVWPSATELELFRRRSPLAARWGDAREAAHLTLEPRRSFGRWRTHDPLGGVSAARRDDGATLFVTYGRVRRAAVRPFLAANARASRQLRERGEFVWGTGFNDRRPGVVGTLTLYRTAREGTGFAYGRGAHQDAIRTTRELEVFDHSWFARLRPVEAEGTWEGQDLLALAGVR